LSEKTTTLLVSLPSAQAPAHDFVVMRRSHDGGE